MVGRSRIECNHASTLVQSDFRISANERQHPRQTQGSEGACGNSGYRRTSLRLLKILASVVATGRIKGAAAMVKQNGDPPPTDSPRGCGVGGQPSLDQALRKALSGTTRSPVLVECCPVLGSCSTVACWPSQSLVTSTVFPSGNSSASWCAFC